MAGAIIAEASLSFLGLGVQPPTPSWGTMLDAGRSHLFDAPHLTIFPGLAIALLVLGFNFLGDGLRDRVDRALSDRPRATASSGVTGAAQRLAATAPAPDERFSRFTGLPVLQRASASNPSIAGSLTPALARA